MADITIPSKVNTKDKQLLSFIETVIRSLQQLKAEVERLERVKANS